MTIRIFLVAAAALTMRAQDPTASEIMARVAENQARTVQARKAWAHEQEVFVRLTRSNGKLAREETRRYAVAPTPSGFDKKMVYFEGRYLDDGSLISYAEPGFERKDLDIDGELVEEFPDELVNSEGSRDGLDSDLFPLTADKQAKYTFQLHGREEYKDRNVYRITFVPAGKDSIGWAGEALIDAVEFQPVLVTTYLSRKLPVVVRTVLGTDIRHIGFKVEYGKFAEGVWFPVKYGGEFYLRALFLYRRNIAISMRNSDFRQTDVHSTIEYAETQR
jgi:hypothetical protein